MLQNIVNSGNNLVSFGVFSFQLTNYGFWWAESFLIDVGQQVDVDASRSEAYKIKHSSLKKNTILAAPFLLFNLNFFYWLLGVCMTSRGDVWRQSWCSLRHCCDKLLRYAIIKACSIFKGATASRDVTMATRRANIWCLVTSRHKNLRKLFLQMSYTSKKTRKRLILKSFSHF